MNCIDLLKIKSMPATRTANISVVTITKTALFCNSLKVGQVTLCTSSVNDSLKYPFIFIVLIILHGRRDSNSRHLVLETSALPTELHPYICMVRSRPDHTLSKTFYSSICVTCPAPTVLPPSRIAKRRPTLIATG
jgi:hypothetical protein